MLTDSKLLSKLPELGGFETLDAWASPGRGIIKTHFLRDVAAYFSSEDSIPPEYLNAFADKLKTQQKIYVVRDGRDVMVSLYRYLQSFDPTYQRMSFSDFLRTENHFGPSKSQDLNRIEFWKKHVFEWTDRTDVLILKFEDLINSYEQTIDRLGQFLKCEADQPLIDVRMKPTSTIKKLSKYIIPGRSRRLIQRTTVQFHSAEIGVYRQFFSESDLELFEQGAGDALRHLNYD